MAPPFPLPDFVTLYRDEPIGITPRAAYYLWSGVNLVVDEWKDALDGDEFELDEVRQSLPPVAGPALDGHFLEQLIRCGEDLLHRLEAAEVSEGLARCTADALTTHLAMLRVADDLHDASGAIDFEGIDVDIPAEPDDRDVEDYTDLYLDDLDFELLYVPSLDGFDSDERIVKALNVRNLHPVHWFDPF